MDKADETVSEHLTVLAVTGSVTYAVVLAVALLRDLWPRLLEKLPWRRRGVVGMRRKMLRRKTGLMGVIYRLKMLYLESYREASWFFFAVEISTLLLSLVCCVLYTLGTYRRDVKVGQWIYNFVVGVFLILEWVIGFWTAELSVKFVASRYTLLSAFAIPSLLLSRGERAYLHFGYLVGYTAYLAFRRLSSRTFFRGFNEKRSLLFETGLHFVTLVFVMACTIQLLEIPGDLLSQSFLAEWEELGDWNLLNSVYYTVVTLSTVGYGDQTPNTLQGRVFAIFAIMVGIILFSNLISNLYEVAARDYGSRSYYKSRSTRHVIVGGSPQLNILRHFISEFYARRQNTYAKIVVLVENPSWTKEEWYGMLETHFLQSRLVYVRGSALNSHDLERARITQADAIFLLSCPTECGNPAQQDIDTVMQGLSVRNLRADIPVYAIAMLRKSSVQLNVSIRLPSAASAEYRESSPAASQYRGLYSNVFLFEYMHLPENAFAEDSESMEEILEKYGCYYPQGKPRESEEYQRGACEFGFSDLYRSESMCLQRLRTTLLAGNIQCNGLGTLMTNMILEVRPERDSMDPEWLQEYHMGAACDLHYAIIPEAFDKVVLQRVALLLYYHGLVLMATQAPNDRYFTPVTTTSTVLHKDHVGMFLTYHRRRFTSVALRAAGMTFRCDPHLYCGGNSQWARELEMKRVVFEQRVSDNPEQYRTPELNFQQMPPEDRVPGDDGYCGTPLYPTFTAEEGPDFNIFDSCLDLTILRRRGQNLGDVPPELERHIIVSADKACVLQDISLFLHTLWKRHGESHFTKRVKKKAVVIISPVIPARLHQEWSQYLGRCLFLVNGSPSTFVAWEKARVKQAQAVISMTNHRTSAIDADARTIFTSLTLDMLTQPESDLFICSELLDESSLEYLREPSHPRRRGAYLGDAAHLKRIKTNHDRMRQMLSAGVESSGEVTVPQPAAALNPEAHEHIWGDPTANPPAPPDLDLSAVASTTERKLQRHASTKRRSADLDRKPKKAGRRRNDENSARDEYEDGDDTGEEEGRSDGAGGKSDDATMSGDGNDRLVDKFAANFDRELKKQGAEAMEAAKTRKVLSPPAAAERGRAESGELRRRFSNVPLRRSSEVGRRRPSGSSPSSSARSAGSRRAAQEESTDLTLTDSEGADLDGKEQRRAVRIKRASLFSRPRYASGELVVYSSLYTLLAREYVEPGFVAFYSDIIGASDGEGAGRKVRLVRVPKFLFEKSKGKELIFRDVFDYIVQLGATPLGLYRSGQGPVRLPRREEDLRLRRGPLLYDKLDAMATCCAADRRRKSCAYKARKLRKNAYSHYLGVTERVGFAVFQSKKEDGRDAYADADSECSSYRARKRNRRSSLERESGQSGSSTSESSGDPSGSEPEVVCQRGVHCFGDHRLEFKELTDCQNILPYVFTLPEPYTVLAEEDGIFVLCDPRFELPDTWPSP